MNELPKLTQDQVKAVIGGAITDNRALYPVETAAVIRSTPVEDRAAVLAVINAPSKDDGGQVERRDALAGLFSGSGLEQRTDAAVEVAEQISNGLREAEVRSLTAKVPGLRDLITGAEKRQEQEQREVRGDLLPTDAEYRQMVTSGIGSAAIPVGTSSKFYDRLRSRAVLLSAGPTVLPIEHEGSLEVPVATGSGATFGTVAEAATIPQTDIAIGKAVLTPKKYGAIQKVSREVIESGQEGLRNWVESALIADLALQLDVDFLTGPGTGGRMKGLTNLTGTATAPALGTDGTDLTPDVIADAIAALEAEDADTDRMAIFMHSKAWAALRKSKAAGGSGDYFLTTAPDGAVSKTIWGVPVHVTNSLPVGQTVGTSTNGTTLVLAAMDQVLVGVARFIEVLYSDQVYWADDMLGIKVTGRYDMTVAQPKSVCVVAGALV